MGASKMNVDEILSKKYPKLIEAKDRYKVRVIKDIPVLLGDRGEIICIPNREEIPSPIAVVGKKGTGKSLILQRITLESFWNLEILVAIMNDSLEECYDWNKKQDNAAWIMQLKLIGESPLALPIIYLYPNSEKLSLDEDITKNINYIKITIPFTEFLDNINGYVGDLGGSDVYLRNKIPDLKKCRNREEVYEVIRTKDISGKMSQGVQTKLITNFNNVFNEQILTITNPDCVENVDVGDYSGNPFVALMHKKLIPCFITSQLYSQRYKNHMYSYHIESIFDAMDGILRGKKVYLIFDELTRVCSTEEKGKNPALDALNQISARGRMKNIGLVYATQNYGKIPHIIKSNTEYLFVLRYSNKQEVKQIKDDFQLPNFNEDLVLKLKKMECVGITSSYFRVYYPNGDVEETDEPVKGWVIPPTSRHKMPK